VGWLTITSLFVSIASITLSAIVWRRMATLELNARREPKNPPEPPSSSFQATLRNYEAVFQELERKSKEAIERIDKRERELIDALAARAAQIPSHPSPDRSQKEREAPCDDLRSSGWTEKAEAIHRLAQEGHDPMAIAQRLGLGKGEVQLVLDIRKTAQ